MQGSVPWTSHLALRLSLWLSVVWAGLYVRSKQWPDEWGARQLETAGARQNDLKAGYFFQKLEGSESEKEKELG